MQKKEFEEVLEIAKDAGKLLKRYYRKENLKKRIKEKSEIVTEADMASQKFIVSELKKRFPEYGVLSEEGLNETDSEKIWVIDPLDGTDNLVSGNPIFSVSIALTDRNFKPELGIVYAPVLDELFYSFEKGKSYFNGKRISVKEEELEKCRLNTYFPRRKELKAETLNLVGTLIDKNIKTIRVLGSAALDICYVGSGVFDGYFHLGLCLWDFCAARLILENAGGKFLYKEREKEQKYIIICGNRTMFKLLRETLKL